MTPPRTVPAEPTEGAFTIEDYGFLLQHTLEAKDDDVTAILSNNFNVIIGALRVAAAPPPPEDRKTMTEAQIKHMVNRFLSWKLPENFSPDGGVSFKKTFNEHTDHPMKHEPSGTNLFDATQATEMVRYMLEDIPSATPQQRMEERRTAITGVDQDAEGPDERP